MADESDVAAALVSAIEAAVYPNGLIGNPPLSVIGAPGRIYRGWPNGVALDADLAAGVFNISVFAKPGMERNTTRFPPVWRVMTAAAPTLTAVVAGATITIGGTIAVPQVVSAVNNDVIYTYVVLISDTLASIATALAALINADTPASAAGPVITLTHPIELAAAVGAGGILWRETKRQAKVFQISLWCIDDPTRIALANVVDPALSGVDFLTLPDGTVGRMIYLSTMDNDAPQKERLFRRDLLYTIEYPTIQTQAATAVATIETDLTAGSDQTDATPPTVVINC